MCTISALAKVLDIVLKTNRAPWHTSNVCLRKDGGCSPPASPLTGHSLSAHPNTGFENQSAHGRAWWCTPLVPARGREWEAVFWFQATPYQHFAFQQTQNPKNLKKKKKKKRKSECPTKNFSIFPPNSPHPCLSKPAQQVVPKLAQSSQA